MSNFQRISTAQSDLRAGRQAIRDAYRGDVATYLEGLAAALVSISWALDTLLDLSDIKPAP